MKKYLKYIGIVISLVALLGIIFFAMDFCRVNNKKNPIFCIKTKVYEDGGTREFLGLGYKVIDFHTINGFYETKIGSYFMKYEDFDDEISKYDNIVIDEIVKSEEYIKQIENDIIKDTFFKKRKEYQINRKKYVDCKLKSYLKESYKNILWYLIFIAIAFATQITQTYFKDIIPNILILSITFSAILFLVPFIRSFIKHDKILTSINYIFSKSKRVYINRRIIHDAILSYNHMTKVPIMVLKKAVDEI